MALHDQPGRLAAVAGLAALLLLRALALAQNTPTSPVGSLGDPKLLRFEGNAAYAADELREALVDDWAVQLASTPSAPLRDYIALLPVRLVHGYEAVGFPDATATAQLLPERGGIVLHITEGVRCPRGEVRIHNARNIDVSTLVKTLTRLPPQEHWTANIGQDGSISITDRELKVETRKPAWTMGLPAPFDQANRSTIRGKVAQALAEQGFLWPGFEVAVQREENKGILNIHLQDEGPRASLGDIEITGLQRNGREDLLAAIGVRREMPVDLRTLRDIQQKLWRLGRFSEHTLVATRLARAGQVKLHITLREIENLPLLRDAPSPVEQALLRFRDWTDLLESEGEDILVSVKRPLGELRAAIGRSSGIAVRFNAEADAFRYGIVATPKHIGTYDLREQIKFAFAPGAYRLQLTIRLRASQSSKDARPHLNVEIGGGLGTQPEGQPPQPFAASISAYPSAALLMAHHPDWKCELAGDTLTVTKGAMVMRIDAATGRLRDMHNEGGPGAETWSLAVGKNAVQREMERLEAEVPGGNHYDAKRPVGSFLAFHGEHLLGAMAHFSPKLTEAQRGHARSAFAKLLTSELLAPVDAIVARPARSKSERLRIPYSPELLPLRAQPESFFVMGIPWCNDVFARGSWPWTISRETLLILGQMSRYSVQELSQLERSDEIGPLGCLAAALVLRNANLTLSRSFAFRGLDLLSAEAFDRDCRVLMSGDVPQAQIMRQVIANIRQLSAGEAEAVARIIGDPLGQPLLRLHQALQPHKDAPISEVVHAIARDYWTNHLRPVVELRLRALTRLPRPPGGKL